MTPPAAAPPDSEPASAPPTRDKAERRRKKLEFAGRVITRGVLAKSDGDAEWLGRASLDSARARADYRARGLHAQLSVEFAGKPRVKNAFVQLRVHDGVPKLDVRAGQFKLPFSAIELESRLDLPMADRGLLHGVLVDRLQVAGRSVGAMLSVGAKSAGNARLDVGVFQGFDDAGNALEASVHDRLGQDAVLRISAEPVRGVAFGAAGEARVGSLNIDVPPIIRRAYAAELDAIIERPAGAGTIRAWLEGMLGTSWISGRAMPCSGPRSCKAGFWETRSIGAYRLGGRERRERYIEVFGLAGVLDPDRDVGGDRVVELTGGITYGAWGVWRLQLEAEAWRFGENAPLGIAQFATIPADDNRFLVQLGARL